MYTAVAVREGVNEDKRERSDGGGDNRVDRATCYTPHQRDPSIHQAGYVLRAGTDKMNLLPISSDSFADEVLKVAPILRRVARVDNLSLQLGQRFLVGSKGRRGFEGSDESIRSACARRFTFYGERGTRLFGVEVVDCAREGGWIVALDQRTRLFVDVNAHLFGEPDRPAHGWAKAGASSDYR